MRRVLKACGFDFDGMLWTNPIAMSYFHDATKRSGTARRGGTEGEVEGEKDTAVVVVREGVAVPDDSTSKNSSKGAFPLTLPGIEPPPKDSRAKRVAMVYLTTFNTIFGRKVGNPTLVANLVDRIEKRMRQGIEAELIFLAPILAKAAGWQYVDGDPTVLLRDGTHGKTAATGQTTGATDHMTKLAGHLDTITLTGRLASAARAIPGAEAWLKDRGVRFEEPGAGA